MKLRPGLKLSSTVSDAQLIVVRAPAADADLRCGGAPMVEGAPPARAEVGGPRGEGILTGKRYSDDDGTIELICTKPGPGELTLDGRPLTVKAAKPLPASDLRPVTGRSARALRAAALDRGCSSASGADRAMCASNFPVDKLFGSFDELYGTNQIVVAESPAERGALFAGTARRIYGL
ncbi:hypothetical protein [Trebonia kvetii]|uniref:hypothetical protein n=1 Tax=Trebonia kvetii TaxID=2480626 RepID=UPI001C9E8C92|nr:hypothetical protein [Trebonia kvetii]